MGKMMQFWWQASETLPLQNIKLWWIPYNNSVLSVQCSIIQWTLWYKYSLFLKLNISPENHPTFLLESIPGQAAGVASREDGEILKVAGWWWSSMQLLQPHNLRPGERESHHHQLWQRLDWSNVNWSITGELLQPNNNLITLIYFNILASAQTHFQNYKYCVLFLTRRQCNGAELLLAIL